MSLLPKEARVSAWLILLLLVVLATLGGLQYRSTQQVSEATARDMEESLQSALFDFRHALERELSGLCLELQSEEGGAPSAVAKEAANRLNLWRQTAQHAGIVRDVFAWDASSDNDPLLISPAGFYRPAPWPNALVGLKDQLRGLSPGPVASAAVGAKAGPISGKPLRFGKDTQFGWMLDQHRLALVHPMIASTGNGFSSRTIWLIVPLDRQFFVQHLLPELSKQQFGGHSENYKVAVVLDDDPPVVLFSSEATYGSARNSAFDARLNLFGPPSMERGPSMPRSPGTVFPAFAESPGDEPHLFIDPLVQAPVEPVLAVIAQHRQGSLDAAVARLRDRNLLVSFGVLGILAVTLTLVIVTSQRARRLARMQMDFVAGVSHELRTPLTAILLAARNLEDGVVGKNSLARYGAAIKNQAAQLSGLVEEILLFSETHSGQHQYRIEPIDLSLGIENTIESLAPLIESSGFTLQQNIEPDLPLVLGDSAAFSQCLQNLITNSLKYGGEKKWAQVTASLTENGGRKEVRVSVEDRGLGIDRNELKKIFEPFFRSPAVVAAQIHGNGLGLPLTKTMVEAMGGKLTVVSTPGEGSVFTIHLRPVDGSSGK